MATTLTNPIATVTLAGTAERITLPPKYSWVWCRNDTEAAVYISQTEDVGEGVSGSVAIPAGGAARLALTGDSFYAVGTGSVQVVAANYTDCPFKTAPAVSGGGSESGVTIEPFVTATIDSKKWGCLIKGTYLQVGEVLLIKTGTYRNYATLTWVTSDVNVNGIYTPSPKSAFTNWGDSAVDDNFRIKNQTDGIYVYNPQSFSAPIELYKVKGVTVS